MKKQQKTFLTNPTTTQLRLVIITWFLGLALMTLVFTDLFTKSFFHKEYLMMYFILTGTTYTMFKVVLNYNKKP